MAPNYPEFKKVTLEDKPYFEFLAKFDSYSDFNLMSLLSWNLSGTSEYSLVTSNTLVLKIKDYLSDKLIYSVLGSDNVDSTLDMLLSDFKELYMVPEYVVSHISDQTSSFLVINEDRDSFDYILSLEKLASLEGSDLKQLRRYVRQFETYYPNTVVKILDLEDPKDLTNIINLTKEWVSQKGYDSSKLTEEIEITENFLRHAPNFNSIALGLFINEKLIAFTLNEIISSDLIMGHFGKADNSYKHASYYMEHLNAKHFLAQGFMYLNHQQDAGLLGLRTAKMTYAPIKFLKKYTITKKEN